MSEKEQFFNSFDELMRLNASLPEEVTGRLTATNINGTDMSLEDIIAIVDGIKKGNKEQLNRRNDLLEYLERTLILIDNNRVDRRNWEWIYGDENVAIDVYEIEEKMEEQIGNLIDVLNKDSNEFAEIFGLMKPSEQMGLASLERQGIKNKNNKEINLPPELYREEIGPFVGMKPKGGRTKRRHYKVKKMKNMKTRKTTRGKGRKSRKMKRKH